MESEGHAHLLESSSQSQEIQKIRRTSRACLQCRSRKQRCHVDPDNPVAPCQRCKAASKACSFESETPRGRYHPYESADPSSRAYEQLRSELSSHRRRIEELEAAVGITAQASPILHPTNGDYRAGQSSSASISSNSPATQQQEMPRVPKRQFTMDGVSLGAPIATLRTLANEDEDEYSDPPALPRMPPPSDASPYSMRTAPHARPSAYGLDPLSQDIITVDEAQSMFDIYFQNCHPLAPLMSYHTQRDATELRHISPFLFTTICSIGARYWHCQPSSSQSWLHPRYPQIIYQLDQCIMALLLRPTSADMCLETVQGLLLYAQWMPLEVPQPGATTLPRSRFNDVSAWSMIGHAIRQALFIGLERCVYAFSGPPAEVTEEDMRRMRVWVNLVSCDHHLVLTARLPMTLDPFPATRVARAFGANPRAEPTDLRYAGLCELIAIVNRAARHSGDAALCALDAVSLQKANRDLDEWDSVWTVVFSSSGYAQFNTQMPFTALRWYRLGLNVVSLGPGFFSGRPGEQREPTSPALRTSIDAAASMLHCLSAEAAHAPLGQTLRALPRTPLTVNPKALASFRFSIDAYWVTHAFATVFLALAFERGAIDQDLNIINSQMAPMRVPPHEASLLARLVCLASDIFDHTVAHPPAAHYREIVFNTKNSLFQPKPVASPPTNGAGGGVEDIFATIMHEGFDWTMDPTTWSGGYGAVPVAPPMAYDGRG
ncbi:hypothetical protein BD626DRAFT_510600 [Schizophyllum amplum]|uniref:Zn(2)-C6 fungal-type domain-containing protein n=1 Tax=Schizophyllum amplum TaxID=97359 RepID=A0A550C1W1_9AGAR|nr:hypothetical protein BD626DRAFT_510600 [Auriculariopsis ampla]